MRLTFAGRHFCTLSFIFYFAGFISGNMALSLRTIVLPGTIRKKKENKTGCQSSNKVTNYKPNSSLTYSGLLKKGKFSGNGTLTFKNGDRYQGNFKDGQFDGKGKFTSVAKWSYEGEFSKGKPNGKGKLITVSDKVFSGRFVNGGFEK